MVRKVKIVKIKS